MLTLLLLSFSLASVVLASLDDPDPILYVQPRHVHLALAEEEGGLIVSWSTINSTDQSLVLLSDGQSGGEKQFHGVSELFTDGGERKATQWIHRVVVTGLRGATTYRYRVGSDLGWSDMMMMRTVASGQDWDPNIVMFGDMGNENAVSLPFIQRETGDGSYPASYKCIKRQSLSW